jgi:histone H3/H4
MPEKQKTIITYSAMRNMMKNAGAYMVAEDAVRAMINKFEHDIAALTKAAIVNADHAKRKKLTISDFELALKPALTSTAIAPPAPLSS